MISEDDLGKIGNLVKTHIGVMAEDFQHQLGAVVDGVIALDEKLDRNTCELKDEIEKSRLEYRGLFASLDEKIDSVRDELKGDINNVRDKLTGEIRAVGGKVDGHEERIQILERRAA